MYQRPGALIKLSNRLTGVFASMGLGPAKMFVLEARGRKSGQPRLAVVNWIGVDGQRYLVAPRGNTEWVRNVRAAGGEGTIKRRGRQRVRLEDVPVEQRAPIIQAYLKENAMVTKAHFGIDPEAPIEEFQRIAADHPVFRIEERSD